MAAGATADPRAADASGVDAPDADEPPGDAAAFGLVDRPSKTRRKQDSHELQALGQALSELPEARLAALPMPEILRDALLELRRTRTHEGRRRQLQYVGKLMHRADPEPLREAVAAMQLGSARETLALHQAEHWRAALIADDEALGRWARAHPDDDLQHLRSLVRAARRDAAASPEQRSGRAFRELFRHVRERLAETEPSPGGPPDGMPPESDDE